MEVILDKLKKAIQAIADGCSHPPVNPALAILVAGGKC
jgi:hypothetical protein